MARPGPAPRRSRLRRLAGILILLVCAYPVLVVALGLAYLAVPPVSTLMLGRWLTLRGAERNWVSLDAMAPSLAAAVAASEDARFCQHRGVDLTELREALDDADEGGRSRGASTIPMQIAKNLFLWPGRSYVRKGLEFPIAFYTDLIWPKRRSMEIYLNIAEWGDGVFGAEAAARRHFGKSARDLTRRESALLAAVLPNPILRDPAKPSRAVSAAASRILDRVPGTPVDCFG